MLCTGSSHHFKEIVKKKKKIIKKMQECNPPDHPQNCLYHNIFYQELKTKKKFLFTIYLESIHILADPPKLSLPQKFYLEFKIQ